MSGSATRSVLLLGATGLVGAAALRLLLDDRRWSRVVVVSRRPVDAAPSPKLEVVLLPDLDRLTDAAPSFAVDAILCALGTTIRQAGSEARFRRVDHDYPLAAARLGQRSGVRHFGLVSALGADPHSRVFYNRVKGDVEEGLRRAGLPSVTILRPSLLLGPRQAFRLGEVLMKPLAPLVPGRYRPVSAGAVARVLVESARTSTPGVEIIESRDIRRLGAGE